MREPTPLAKLVASDCIAGMSKWPTGFVDLAFADPPFNIGYEYDLYHDRREYCEYINWSVRWMREVVRLLKPDGTFWLAIGDEYAAELKIKAQDELGLTCRSWVIWYYTFGVHCVRKFSRSHTHLLYFVKDPKNFIFNDEAIRVPSARQLVYGDARANPRGRLPDDTWILRPQDVPDGFLADQDTWYFPRVAGTFKERAGFHGCQMPEQLLGRIIRCCCPNNGIVLDPFAGSGTTLAVAKKLGRQWLGFELSPEYVKHIAFRLAECASGDPLEGAPEPTRSAPATPPPTATDSISPAPATVATNNLSVDPQVVGPQVVGPQVGPTVAPAPASIKVSPAEAMLGPTAGATSPADNPSNAIDIASTAADATPSSTANGTQTPHGPTQIGAVNGSPTRQRPTAARLPTEDYGPRSRRRRGSYSSLPISELGPKEEEPINPEDWLGTLFANPDVLPELPPDATEADTDLWLARIFAETCAGFSSDRLLADPELNAQFIEACRRAKFQGSAYDWNRALMRLRKSGKLASHRVTQRTSFSWQELDCYLHAVEVALARLLQSGRGSVDDILCDPEEVEQFDRLASSLAPGYSPLQYRWAALRIRKDARLWRRSARQLPASWKRRRPSTFLAITALHQPDWANRPAVYVLRLADGVVLYVGATLDFARRHSTSFGPQLAQQAWLRQLQPLFAEPSAAVTAQEVELGLIDVTELPEKSRRGLQSYLIHHYQPRWNLPELDYTYDESKPDSNPEVE